MSGAYEAILVADPIGMEISIPDFNFSAEGLPLANLIEEPSESAVDAEVLLAEDDRKPAAVETTTAQANRAETAAPSEAGDASGPVGVARMPTSRLSDDDMKTLEAQQRAEYGYVLDQVLVDNDDAEKKPSAVETPQRPASRPVQAQTVDSSGSAEMMSDEDLKALAARQQEQYGAVLSDVFADDSSDDGSDKKAGDR